MNVDQILGFMLGFLVALPLERKFNLMQKIKDYINKRKQQKGAK